MPTHDRSRAAGRDEVAETVARVARGRTTTGSGIGLELELFPVSRTRPTRRLRLEERVSGAPAIAAVLAEADDLGEVSVTVEPGGQIELSTTCCQQVTDALRVLERASARLATHADRAGVDLLAAGTDVWHDVTTVPQQLDRPRYRAMDAAFAARGDEGRLMMRHTCALQVNLDLGDGAEREDRWQVANLLAPVATATFATSPASDHGRPVASRRSLAWQRLDPTRTGFPRGILTGRGQLADHLLAVALAADVLYVRTPDGDAIPGRAGWDLAAWVDDGHPFGWPTAEDVEEHLTTLFLEARPRGFVELRSVDAVPARFRTAAVVLLAGALQDARVRAAIRGVLEPHRAALPRLARRCATVGLADPRLCALAVEVWSYARAGAASCAGIGRAELTAVDAFLDRFTVRGRAPGDELAERLRCDPMAARHWATEPSATAAEVLP